MPKLQIDAQLTAQEILLGTQIVSIENKRTSFKSAIQLFATENTTKGLQERSSALADTR